MTQWNLDPLTDAQRQREEAIVKSALERAALKADAYWGGDVIANDIRALASDPEAVAEIIAAAARGNNA